MLKCINWEITYRCNLHCGFCYLRGAKKLNSPKGELEFKQAKAFIESVAGLGTDFYITGGEPFARQDCLDILECIKARGGHCGVNTNGTLLDRRKIARLAAIGLDYVIFSLHGTPRIHDELCGKIGVFARVAENIRRLSSIARAGTEIIVSCTLNERNYRHMERLFLICRDLGAHRVLFEHLQFLSPAEKTAHKRRWNSFYPRPCRIITPCRASHQELDARALARQVDSLARRGYDGVHFDVRPKLSSALLDQWYNGGLKVRGGCQAAQEVMVVAPNGDVRLCQLYDKKIGNVTAAGWRKIWSGEDSTRFRARVAGSLFPGCARCCQRFKIFRYY